MSEKRISYLNRTFNDYKQALIEFSKKYYPSLTMDYNDASIMSWLLDINADIADNLSYHIDRVFQETNINSANEMSSMFALARSNGFKVPGPKGAMAEVELRCSLPLNSSTGPDWSYAPIVRRGTKFTAGSQVFELLEDVDFSNQFDNDGNTNRTITPIANSNGLIVRYDVTKLVVVVAGETKVFRKAVYTSDVKPFMEVVLPETNVMNVESVVVRRGTGLQTTPTYGDFYSEKEEVCNGDAYQAKRYFEVDSLAQQFRWGVKETNDGKAVIETYMYDTYPVYQVTKGEWKPVNYKFITEYTDKGYLKIIFGSGLDTETNDATDISNAKNFSKFKITRLIRNNSLGYLPNPDSTIFVLYRVGGGKSSNVAAGAINKVSYLNAEIGGSDASTRENVKKSITVVSTTPSVSGKDMPSPEELKYLIKYNNGSQNRCMTVKDYIARVLQMPPKFGTPFRVNASEENNKIMLYLLGLDNNGKLDATLPTALISNVRDYIAGYRMINDFIEIKSGKIINIGIDVDVFVDKNYNKSDVVADIINTIINYFDINKHQMGDDIFVGDVEKEISKVDGVINLIDLKVYNIYGGNYSKTLTEQETLEPVGIEGNAYEAEIDLEASDYVIYSNGDEMLEIKYPENGDIKVRCKTR